MKKTLAVVSLLSWVMFIAACFLPALTLVCKGKILIWAGWECMIQGLLGFPDWPH